MRRIKHCVFVCVCGGGPVAYHRTQKEQLGGVQGVKSGVTPIEAPCCRPNDVHRPN